MADDYTPTMSDIEDSWTCAHVSEELTAERSREAFKEALAAHDAEKRAEWEGEQGEPEWEYAWNWSSHPYRDPMPLEGGAPERAAYLADIEQRIAPTVVFRRTREVPAGPWLPVPDTASESREERSPAEGTAPHWSIIRAGSIVIAEGYCWCNDPNGGYHQIGIKPAPVPDITKEG